MRSPVSSGRSIPHGPLPARAGIGLRACHHEEVLRTLPAIAWFEAHSENYFSPGGELPRILERIRERYPLSLHGVGLGLGNVDPLDVAHLAALRRLVDRYQPALVSEHVCWGAIGGRFTNDLIPMPYTEEALWHLVARVRVVQEALGRQILVENVSSYLQFRDAQFTEWDFLAALAAEAGCAILLDVNNVYVSAMNHGFDARAYLEAIPVAAVKEMHLAGHSINHCEGREIRIDTHGTPVCDAVWDLYRFAARRFEGAPALIEWDTDIPALHVLQAEASKADSIREARDAVAA
jgi:uncharacterized protein (UPF0276 family)